MCHRVCKIFAATTRAVARSLGQDPLRRHCLDASLNQHSQYFDINVAEPLNVKASLAASVFACSQRVSLPPSRCR